MAKDNKKRTYLDLLDRIADALERICGDFKEHDWSDNVFTQEGSIENSSFNLDGSVATTQNYSVTEYFDTEGSKKIRYSYYRGEEPWLNEHIRVVLYDSKKRQIGNTVAEATVIEEDETYTAEVATSGAVYFRMSLPSGYTSDDFTVQLWVEQS